MRQTWVWSLGWEDPLEKEMATHSSILAWRIPWTEEPGGLQSTGLQSGTWLSNFSFTFKSKRPGSKGCIVYNYMHMTFWKRQSYRNIEQISGYQELKGEVSFVYYNRFYLICGGRGLEVMKLFCFFIVLVIIQLCFCQIS